MFFFFCCCCFVCVCVCVGWESHLEDFNIDYLNNFQDTLFQNPTASSKFWPITSSKNCLMQFTYRRTMHCIRWFLNFFSKFSRKNGEYIWQDLESMETLLLPCLCLNWLCKITKLCPYRGSIIFFHSRLYCHNFQP